MKGHFIIIIIIIIASLINIIVVTMEVINKSVFLGI